MSSIPTILVRHVVERAQDRCEYCGLSQVGQEATFHIDHVLPRVADGPTTLENLALACESCSLRKGARQFAIDPETNAEVGIFNPRTQSWQDHFQWDEILVEGLTPTGRATVVALEMNRASILTIREEEIDRGRHPPPG